MNEAHPEKTSRWSLVALLGIGHGLGDFIAGAVLASLQSDIGGDVFLSFMLYNVLAFAAQPLAGWIIDRHGRRLAWFAAGGAMSAAALMVARLHPWAAIVLAGTGSALYHSAGGAAAVASGRGSALAAGIFSAPGVLGLTLGMIHGARLGLMAEVSVIGVLLCVLIGVLGLDDRTKHEQILPRATSEDWRGWLGGALGWVIILAIAARSFAWSLGQESLFPSHLAVGIAIAAAIGKTAGGLLAVQLGCERITAGALGVAIVLLTAAQFSEIWLLPAAAALQAGTGPMLTMALRAWPRQPAFASGLAQGMAVALGGIPLLFFRHQTAHTWLLPSLLLGLLLSLICTRLLDKAP